MIQITTLTSSHSLYGYLVGDCPTREIDDLERKVHGLAAERLGIDGLSAALVFDDLLQNRIPDTDDRLTARNVAHRRQGFDVMIDVPKSLSIHYAATGDTELARIIGETNHETVAKFEPLIQTQIRGTTQNFATGNCMWSAFAHTTARPVNGLVDMQFHQHIVIPNATFNESRERWQAIEPGNLKVNAPRIQQEHDDRLTQKLRNAGYRLRTTANGFELAYVTDRDIRAFSRRSEVIKREAVGRKDKLELDAMYLSKRTGMPYEKALAVKKGELGASTREPKSSATLTEPEQRAEWRGRLFPGQWDSLSVPCAKSEEVHHKTMQLFETRYAFTAECVRSTLAKYHPEITGSALEAQIKDVVVVRMDAHKEASRCYNIEIAPKDDCFAVLKKGQEISRHDSPEQALEAKGCAIQAERDKIMNSRRNSRRDDDSHSHSHSHERSEPAWSR